MAPHKQPTSLYDAAYHTYLTLLYKAFLGVARRHGSRCNDSEECVQAIRDLQNAIVANIPGNMWSDLCERLLSFMDTYNPYKLPFDSLKVLQYLSLRKIAYGVFAHEKLSRLTLTECIIYDLRFHVSPSDEKVLIRFWENMFKDMSKVTKIVFSLYIELNRLEWLLLRWLFELIGNLCHNLEDIYLDFKVFLPPRSLGSLLKCTKLRRIGQRGAFGSASGSGKYCKIFLESLPDLEFLADPQVVTCFPDIKDGHSLKLTDLIVDRQRSTPVYVALAVKLCANLKRLDISPLLGQECSAVLEILTKCNVNLTSLTLRSDSYSSDVYQRFFSSKGVHLLNLEFCCCNFTLKTAKVVGEYCRNLRSLSVEGQLCGSEDVVGSTESDASIYHRSPVFKKLSSLSLEHRSKPRDWDRRIVTWCLLQATNLETLNLLNWKTELNLEDFRDMFSSERLPELVCVTLRLCYLDEEMIQCLYDNCPSLRKLTICSTDVTVREHANSLRSCVARNNIDLTVAVIHN